MGAAAPPQAQSAPVAQHVPSPQNPTAHQVATTATPVAQAPAAQPSGVQQPARPPASALAPPKTSKTRLDDLPVYDVDVDEKAGQASAFSVKFIAVGVFLLAAGVLFGTIASSAGHTRAQYNAQKEGAQKLQKDLEPKLKEADKLIAAIKVLSPTQPDAKITELMDKIDFVPPAGMFSGSALLVGSSNIDNIVRFQSKAFVLKEAIKQHHRLTSKTDAKELKGLIKNNKIISGNQNLAIIYDYKQLLEHIKSKAADKKFKPSVGRVVSVPKFKVDKKGEVKYEGLVSKGTGKWSVRGMIPISIGDIFKSGGENALLRYQKRVNYLKYYASELEKSKQGLLDEIKKISSRPDAPIISFTSAASSEPSS